MRRPGLCVAAGLVLLWAVVAVSESAAQRSTGHPLARRTAMEAKEARRLLVGGALTSSALPRDLLELCDRLAERATASRAGREAEDWGYVALREAGLRRVRFEDFRLRVWRPRTVEAEALGLDGRRTLRPRAFARSASTAEEGVELSLVPGGDCTASDLAELGEAVVGRAVLCEEGPAHRLLQMRHLVEAGASAMVLVSDAEPRYGSVGLDRVAALPALSLSREEGVWLRRKTMEDPEGWRIRIVVVADEIPTRARNVTGELPGRDEGETILVSAHLDAWPGPGGCLDNATGVAVLLEAARLLGELAERGWTPERTVRFVLFMGEEQGLHGSRAWVRRHRSALEKVRAVVNLEMPGAPRGLVSHGHDEVLPFLEGVARRLAGLGMKEVRNEVVLHSDHQPFLVEGVPTLGLLSPRDATRLRVWHTDADTHDKLEPAATHQAAAAAGVLLFELADADEPPLRRYGPDETEAMLRAHGVAEVLEAIDARD